MSKDSKQLVIQSDNHPTDKHSTIIQLLIVIGSGILSSSVIATALKTWLDNQKTTLKVQIEGETKKLEYTGPRLHQDATVIQHLLNNLTEARQPSSTHPVTINLIYDQQEEAYVLAPDRTQQATITQENNEPVSLPPSRIKQFLPGWLHRK